MATQPSKTITRGCQLLELMAQHPRELRTVASLVELSEGSMTAAQVEGALGAFVEAGVVQERQTQAGPAFYLLGSWHLRLAAAELEGLLSDLEQARGLLGGMDKLQALGRLLNGF